MWPPTQFVPNLFPLDAALSKNRLQAVEQRHDAEESATGSRGGGNTRARSGARERPNVHGSGENLRGGVEGANDPGVGHLDWAGDCADARSRGTVLFVLGSRCAIVVVSSPAQTLLLVRSGRSAKCVIKVENERRTSTTSQLRETDVPSRRP